MSEFKAQQSAGPDGLRLAFEGNIDEDVVFPQVESGKYPQISIDLQAVKSINSVGIREWLNWMKPLAGTSKIVLARAPKALVFQMNMVEGFLPKGSTVQSFYVPYFCEKCDKEENVLFTVGKEAIAGPAGPKINFDISGAKICAEAECDMEMDASEAKYFQFLKKLA